MFVHGSVLEHLMRHASQAAMQCSCRCAMQGCLRAVAQSGLFWIDCMLPKHICFARVRKSEQLLLLSTGKSGTKRLFGLETLSLSGDIRSRLNRWLGQFALCSSELVAWPQHPIGWCQETSRFGQVLPHSHVRSQAGPAPGASCG